MPRQPFPSSPTTSSLGTEGAKSLPRIHQPTVIRRPSGKGVSFVPPPAEVSSPGQPFAIHQPGLRSPSPFGPTRTRRSISPIRRHLENFPESAHHRSLPDLADMLRRGTIEVSPARPPWRPATEPVEYGGAPTAEQVAQANEDAKSDDLHEVVESKKVRTEASRVELIARLNRHSSHPMRPMRPLLKKKKRNQSPIIRRQSRNLSPNRPKRHSRKSKVQSLLTRLAQPKRKNALCVFHRLNPF